MVRQLVLIVLSAAFVGFLVPRAARACYAPGGAYPPVQGTTHIESVSP